MSDMNYRKSIFSLVFYLLISYWACISSLLGLLCISILDAARFCLVNIKFSLYNNLKLCLAEIFQVFYLFYQSSLMYPSMFPMFQKGLLCK